MKIEQMNIIDEKGLHASLIRCGDELRLRFRSDADGLDSVFYPNDRLISDIGIGLYSAADFVDMMLNAPGYSKHERQMMGEFIHHQHGNN